MSEINVNLPFVSIPESRLTKILCWLPKKLSGTHTLENKVDKITGHVSAMTDIMHLMVSKLSKDWSDAERERTQKIMGHFEPIMNGVDGIKVTQNPFTQQDIDKLKLYVKKAQNGEKFLPQEATEFKTLSDRVANEYAGQDWVTELLKVAFFIFAVYAIGKLLEPNNKSKYNV